MSIQNSLTPVSDLRNRVVRDFQRRLFEHQVFHKKRMKDLARSLVDEYVANLADEDLLHMARYDQWLRTIDADNLCEVGRQDPYYDDTIVHICRNLAGFLKRELFFILDTFWSGETRVVVRITRDSMELVGFANEEIPDMRRPPTDLLEEMMAANYSPYA